MKNPFKKLGAFIGGVDDKVVALVKAAVTEGVEHGEAEVLDLVAGVVEKLNIQDLVEEGRKRLILALNERAAELRK